MTTYRIKVQRWVWFEEVVMVRAPTERDARVLALTRARTNAGVITKNKTTILEKVEKSVSK